MINPWEDIAKPSANLNVRLVGVEHPLRFYWGVDAQGSYLFVYDALMSGIPDKKSMPNLSGIGIHVIPEGKRGKLALILEQRSDWEIFHSLCMDLHRATARVKDESNAPGIILRRLQRWQEFLKRDRARILSIEAIKGLIGELLFLRNQIAPNFGWANAISFWKGPEDAPQDFAVNETAVEVKCQSGGSQPTVRINSQDQLTPQLPEGFLVVQTLAGSSGHGEGVFSLNTLIDDVRTMLEVEPDAARERFDDLVYLAGYVHSEKYDENQFTLVDTKSYALREGFPRITSDQIMAGVDKVSYSIRLEECEDFLEKPDWWGGDK
tara:strand:+ start:234 stop:1199 length:966 start_codon:yes stop_codon:yes gene_type:complete